MSDEIVRGNDAQFILNHKIYQEAWQSARDALARKRRECPIKDAEMAMRLIIAEQLLDSLEKYITDVVTTGKMAELQLKEIEQRRNWFRVG